MKWFKTISYSDKCRLHSCLDQFFWCITNITSVLNEKKSSTLPKKYHTNQNARGHD